MNDFSRLFQDNENREPNDSMNKESITETEKNKKIFILDFSKAIKILITNFNNLTNSNKLTKYPTLEKDNDIQSLLNFFKLIFQPDSYNKSFQNISDSINNNIIRYSNPTKKKSKKLKDEFVHLIIFI